jgi:hypothetical protein
MPRRTRVAASVGLLAVLLAGCAGAGWWASTVRTQIQEDLAGVNEARVATQHIGGTGGLVDIVGSDDPAAMAEALRLLPIQIREARYAALDTLDAAELTFEARSIRDPLRSAVDDYYAAADEANRNGFREFGGRAARQVEEVRTIAGTLLTLLEACEEAFRADLETARTVGAGARATAMLLVVIAGALVIRSIVRRTGSARR